MNTIRRKRITNRWGGAISQMTYLSAQIAEEEYAKSDPIRKKRAAFRKRAGAMMVEEIEKAIVDQKGAVFSDGARAVLRFISENVSVRGGKVEFRKKLKGWDY